MSLAYERDPAAIYRQSFATVRAESRLSHLPAASHDLAIRVAHACGMPDITDDLVVSPNAIIAGKEALLRGAPILVDAQMVAHGIIARRLPPRCAIVCTLDEPEVRCIAERERTTRSAAQVELWRDRLEGAVVVIGNAPTALFRLLELATVGEARPSLVIGMPVGFVGAVESKDLLCASNLAHVAVRGRRGGSAMAAAATNALAGGLD